MKSEQWHAREALDRPLWLALSQLLVLGDAACYPYLERYTMLSRRLTLFSLVSAVFSVLTRQVCGEGTKTNATSNPIYLHVYSDHHLPDHDPESKETRKPTFENPIYTRVITMSLAPDVEYFLRCPNKRNPDIGVYGHISYKPDGTIEGKDLSIEFDDSSTTHGHSFSQAIQLDRIHASSDVTFWYVFSLDKDPYAVLPKAKAHG